MEVGSGDHNEKPSRLGLGYKNGYVKAEFLLHKKKNYIKLDYRFHHKISNCTLHNVHIQVATKMKR